MSPGVAPRPSPGGRRVALVHRYFHPDVTGYAQMLDQFGAHLAAIGHDVTIICGPPGYNAAYQGPPVPRVERRNGCVVRRLRVPQLRGRLGKSVDYAAFAILVATHLVIRRRPYDVVSVTTIPPVVMGLAGRCARLRSRRTNVVYHCMDLYPEVASTVGLRQDGPAARIARRLDNSTVARAARTIVLSDDMRRTLAGRGADTERVAVCNNFILEDASAAIAPTGIERPAGRRFIFAGNLGRFQGIESLVDAFVAAHDAGADAELVLLGAGPMTEWIRDAAARSGAPITVWPHRPLPEAMGLMQTADVGVVSLSAGVSRHAFPSKLMMYLELGLPVLAIVEQDSELARTVRDHGLGTSAAPGAVDEIVCAVRRLAASPLPSADHVRSAGRALYAPSTILPRWTELYGLEAAA